MKIRHLLIAQFFAWAGFTFIDLVREKTSIFYDIKQLTDIEVEYVMCFVIPIILGVLYFIRKKLLWNDERERSLKKQIKQLVISIGIWLPVTIISTIIISVLALNNIWIVYQHQRGFENFLNGAEYLFFGFCLLVIPIGLVLIGEFLILIIVKCNSYWRLHKRN